MKGEKLVNLILEYKEEFLFASMRRQTPSTSNKQLHQTIIELLSREDTSMVEIGLYAAVYNSWYHKPLEGVIYVLRVDSHIKQEFIDAYQEVL